MTSPTSKLQGTEQKAMACKLMYLHCHKILVSNCSDIIVTQIMSEWEINIKLILRNYYLIFPLGVAVVF
jgi:hypothetical protein